jgi:Tol biopolymer transport system component/DNA-binding winged helix-turn-helix (wHTH) protein
MANAFSTGPAVRFGDFELDLQSGELTQNGSRVLLADQPFRLLAILIRERGSLVTRDDLRRELWSEGTFVDFDPSINAAVKRVREVLGDSAAAPQFVETLPRRGYRFIAPVHEVAPATSAMDDEKGAPPGLTPAATGPSRLPLDVNQIEVLGPVLDVSPGRRSRLGWTPIALVLASGIGILTIGLLRGWLAPFHSGTSQLTISRVTNDGSVQAAALSQDGRTLAYVKREGVRESLWLKRAGDSQPIRLRPPVDATYKSLTFAPGDSLHYTLFRPDRTLVEPFTLSIAGGSPAQMVGPAGRISFDRSGSRYAYVASFSLAQRESRIVVSPGFDGDVRVLAVRRPPESFVRIKPAWSHDGSRLAVFGVSETAPAALSLIVLDARNGRILKAVPVDLVAVDSALWLPEGLRLVVSGRATNGTPERLWICSIDSGALRPLTTDLSDYRLVGFSQDTGQIVAVRGDVARSVWMADLNRLDAPRAVAQNSGEVGELEGLAWATNDTVLYTAAESGNIDLWSVKVHDGTRHRLTTDPADDFHPSATADGRTVVFASSRGGVSGIWSMNGDGTGQRRLTEGADVRPSVARDGRMLVFQRGAVDTTPFTLWRLPIGDTRPTALSDHHSMRPALSPDGQSVAHYLMTAEAWMLAVTPLAGGAPQRTIPIAETHATRIVRWSSDSRAVAYIDGAGGASNIWVQPLARSPAERLTHFAEGRISTFDWSPDGSRLAWIRVSEVRDVVLIDFPGLNRHATP